MRKIILASTSPRRRAILKRTGLRFTIEKSDYEEDMTLKMSPRELAKFLSRGKAEAVAKHHKNAIVIGADTFVVFKNKLMGKPHMPANARKMLRMLSGKTNSILTGLTVIDTANGKTISRVSEAKVSLRKLTSKEIDAYVRSGEPLDRAGAYDIHERGSVFIRKIEGDYAGALGLPIGVLADILKKFGVEVL
jgi:septum formation protein